MARKPRIGKETVEGTNKTIKDLKREIESIKKTQQR